MMPPVTLRKTYPVFLVGDIAATMRWYSTVLGFSADPVPVSPPHSFCILSRDEVCIFLQQLDGYRQPDLYERRDGGVWHVYIQMRGVRELFRTLSQREDVRVLEPVCHQPYGQTEFVISDPNGYALAFAERD